MFAFSQEVRFTKDVAPIFYNKCVTCHRPGDIAPMSLIDYTSARPWARAIREAVITRKMPPWFADPHYGEFANDSRLTQQEIDTIARWVDGGAQEGDARDLSAMPTFVEGWQLGTPDIVIDIGQDFSLSCLYRNVPEQKLNLIQFAAGEMTQSCARPPEIMWREFVNARLARSIFHDFPQNLRRHAVSPDSTSFVGGECPPPTPGSANQNLQPHRQPCERLQVVG
jgi:hypothetical protein